MLVGLVLIWTGPTSSLLAQEMPVKVEIRETKKGFELLRAGEPYYVKGAGGKSHLPELVAAGGNSVRTWGADKARKHLDNAHAHGLTVTVGLWVGHERHGFDYNNEAAVKAQLEKFRKIVMDVKDHPALLIWGIGNEVDLNYSNHKVWDAIEDIAAMIKELDPNHPTMTVTAGIKEANVRMIKEQCPSIDILGINTYGEIGDVPEKIRAFGWEKPYMVPEWGPTGHWESPNTAWGVPVEQSSFEKAEAYERSYSDVIYQDREMCLGSYVFLWGNKQETTATWYGLFLPTGEPTETVDRLCKVWSGKWPQNRAPSVSHMTIDGKKNGEDIYLMPGQEYEATVAASDPEGREMKIRWGFYPESTEKKSGGDHEDALQEIEGLAIAQEGNTLRFTAPSAGGAYRLFVFAFDESGKAGTVNAPFFVKE